MAMITMAMVGMIGMMIAMGLRWFTFFVEIYKNDHDASDAQGELTSDLIRGR